MPRFLPAPGDLAHCAHLEKSSFVCSSRRQEAGSSSPGRPGQTGGAGDVHPGHPGPVETTPARRPHAEVPVSSGDSSLTASRPPPPAPRPGAGPTGRLRSAQSWAPLRAVPGENPVLNKPSSAAAAGGRPGSREAACAGRDGPGGGCEGATPQRGRPRRTTMPGMPRGGSGSRGCPPGSGGRRRGGVRLRSFALACRCRDGVASPVELPPHPAPDRTAGAQRRSPS